MACSVSGQDESDPTLSLATRAGKMELSFPLGTTHRVPQEKFPRKPYNKSFIDQACSLKIYHLLTESEVITGKSQTEALMYVNTSRLRF